MFGVEGIVNQSQLYIGLISEPISWLRDSFWAKVTVVVAITLTQYIYDLSFEFVPNFGYAATVSYVIVFFTAVLSILQFRVAGDDPA